MLDARTKLLSTCSRSFAVDSVNSNYKAIMTRIATNPNALVCCRFPGYLALLEGMDKSLEEIQRALDQYLENKRQQFPRFYFLSNDDLLEILGQSKDPVQVQKHVREMVRVFGTELVIARGSTCPVA